jgi:hypothetical protein
MDRPDLTKCLAYVSSLVLSGCLNPVYNVLLCAYCCYALSPTALPRHLSGRHQTGVDIWRQVRQYVECFPFAYSHATVPLPADGSAPQPIIPIVCGLACRSCTFKSTVGR